MEIESPFFFDQFVSGVAGSISFLERGSGAKYEKVNIYVRKNDVARLCKKKD